MYRRQTADKWETRETKNNKEQTRKIRYMQNQKADRKCKRHIENRRQTKKRYEKTDDVQIKKTSGRKTDGRFWLKKREYLNQVLLYAGDVDGDGTVFKKDNVMVILSNFFPSCFKRLVYRKSKIKSQVVFSHLIFMYFKHILTLTTEYFAS